MSGHSKWANIKHKKAAQDSKRSNLFQKFSTEILVAIKAGGNDPDKNARLRLAIEKAKARNMPNDNIKKLLSRSEKDPTNFTEVTYEGYGPFGVAFLVECLTDNINRTASFVKSVFNKLGGNLGTSGSVSYLFKVKGQIILDETKYDSEDVFTKLLEFDIIDFSTKNELIIIDVLPANLIKIKENLEKKGIKEYLSSEITKIPNSYINLSEENLIKVQKLIDSLEDNNDIQNVYTNLG
ncbi:/ pmpR / Transcriptional regulatory protein PmpR /:497295 Reverse [Candidatus Hepatoplasma crinochetorum]|uniref:Probable transcriptional regulatory protein HEPPS_02120 n=1 Tax=Candidatus Hepatoplasma crinochetorum TaxID=295596 RepID=A0A0G7ZLI4_9MOLU|nr:/ pmpR / Transcriptional regulatory protein PmpR /:497295 Reverse [Candidatus Hepatoplasma crinochetorum]